MRRNYIYFIIITTLIILGICLYLYFSNLNNQREPFYDPSYDPKDRIKSAYEKDKNTVYYLGQPIPDADPDSFIIFPAIHQNYGKDKNYVFFGIEKVVGANAKTFESDDVYGNDGQNVYYFGMQILGADPETFEVISLNYSKDSQHVYWMTTVINGADVKTIEAITDYGFAKDKNHVYEMGKILPGVDPATFVPPEPG